MVNSKIGGEFFPQTYVACFFWSSTVRIGQKLLNEVPVESSILADIVNSEAFNRNLNGSMHMDPNRQKRTTKSFNVNMIIAFFLRSTNLLHAEFDKFYMENG